MEAIDEQGARDAFRRRAITRLLDDDITGPLDSLHAELRQVAESQSNVSSLFEREFGAVRSRNPVDQGESFSWIVCDRDGFQIARVMKNENTLGQQFNYRSYFTGGPEDALAPVEWQSDSSEPRLSACFLTKDEREPVLAISAPIWDGSDFQGVVGIFIELRHLAPDLEESIPEESRAQFAAIYDSRAAEEGNALLIWRSGSAVELGENAVYHDLNNLTDLSGADGLKPEVVPIGDETGPVRGLHLLMLEQSPVKEPGRNLRNSLVVMGLSIVAFAAAVLIPVWIIILRRIVRQ